MQNGGVTRKITGVPLIPPSGFVPTWFRFATADWGGQCTRALTNNHFNAHARESLESLRPSDTCALKNGFRANGWLRAIDPAAITLGREIRVRLEVDIDWNAARIIIACVVDGDRPLFPMRPLRGRSSWIYGAGQPAALAY